MQYLSLHIFYQPGIVPECVKPLFQVGAVAVTINNQIEFNVGRVGQAQPTAREVGAAQQGVFALAIVNVVELAMQ